MRGPQRQDKQERRRISSYLSTALTKLDFILLLVSHRRVSGA